MTVKLRVTWHDTRYYFVGILINFNEKCGNKPNSANGTKNHFWWLYPSWGHWCGNKLSFFTLRVMSHTTKTSFYCKFLTIFSREFILAYQGNIFKKIEHFVENMWLKLSKFWPIKNIFLPHFNKFWNSKSQFEMKLFEVTVFLYFWNTLDNYQAST